MHAAVKVHVLWMLVAVAVGTWSGYLGLLRATLKDGKSFLPGRFTLRSHKWTGIVFYAMLFAGIVYGIIMADFILKREAEGFWAWHARLAWSIGALYLVGMVVGLEMLWQPPGRRRVRPIIHMVLNFTACALVAVQMVLAASAVGWV